MLRRAALLPVVWLGVTPAKAESPDPHDLHEYRTLAFGTMGTHMKALSMIVKGEVPSRQPDLVAHATSLHAMSQVIPHLFPEGTGPDILPETDATPAIWLDPEGFAAAAKAFEDESGTLAEMARAGNTEGLKVQFGKVGRSCGGCHDGYRKDDN